MTDVRPAIHEDRPALIGLCALLHAENGQHGIDWPRVEAMVDRCLAQAGGFIGVIGPVGDPVAAIMILLDGGWYSHEFQLLEIFNYVHPEHRRTDYARSLIEYGKGCADALNLDLTIGVFSNVRVEAKTRLYARMLPKAGELFCYRPARAEAEIADAAE